MSASRRIAYFVSPHGFGHATRTAAVVAAVQQMMPSVEVEILTSAPRRLFDQSLTAPFTYHHCVTDIGMAQDTPLCENLGETLRLLNIFFPLDDRTIAALASRLTQSGCDMIVCDIAPMGIAVGRAAGIRSVLIENFTWDWIYGGYIESEPGFARYVAYLSTLFEAADYHIRAEPVCEQRPCHVTVAPIARRVRSTAEEVRGALGIGEDASMVLVSMGGTPSAWRACGELHEYPGVHFVVPSDRESIEVCGNATFLPGTSDFYHPDLVAAADAVLGKLGYSTLAEAYYAGTPLGYVTRPSFRECSVLKRFVDENMQGLEISCNDFEDGTFAPQLDELLNLARSPCVAGGGAEEAAHFICGCLP